MSEALLSALSEGTSSAPPGWTPGKRVLGAGAMVCFLATPLTEAVQVEVSMEPPFLVGWSSGTNAGWRVPSARPLIAELRRISGLTWEELGTLLGTSVCDAQRWASGGRISASERTHAERVLDVFREADRGAAQVNRRLLFDGRIDGGESPFSLLSRRQYQAAGAALGAGQGGRRLLPSISPREREARHPLPPSILIDARHEVAHTDLPGIRRLRTERDAGDESGR